jgi:hypothetical protein
MSNKRLWIRVLGSIGLVAGIVVGVVALNGGPAVAGPTPDCGPNFMWDCTMPNGSHQFVDATRCEIAAFQRQTGARCVISDF